MEKYSLSKRDSCCVHGIFCTTAFRVCSRHRQSTVGVKHVPSWHKLSSFYRKLSFYLFNKIWVMWLRELLLLIDVFQNDGKRWQCSSLFLEVSLTRIFPSLLRYTFAKVFANSLPLIMSRKALSYFVHNFLSFHLKGCTTFSLLSCRQSLPFFCIVSFSCFYLNSYIVSILLFLSFSNFLGPTPASISLSLMVLLQCYLTIHISKASSIPLKLL